MAVLSKEQRLELLAQSTYAKKTSSTNKGKANKSTSDSSTELKRKTGFRKLTQSQIDKLTSTNKQVDTKQLKLVISDPQSKISRNPHRQELDRLHDNPHFIDNDPEHYEQTQFFCQIIDLFPLEYRMTCATPNGGQRIKGERFRLLGEGLQPGWPDTQCSIARQGYHGLYIEFKKPLNKFRNENEAIKSVKAHQRSTLRMLNYFGNCTHVAFGWQEGLDIFKAYHGYGDKTLSELELFYPRELLLPPTDGEELEFLREWFTFSDQP
ncbi:hypothetical protein HUO09_17395 [Vibrio sp. Y2-5]|uniref:hypothetical protein n=1 Tax=Vibrio sp. Y2-5 TaxID=2743977 RepID=UPI0016601895|nr:hypothetical protein [Vibrio sp. Y2-5]MBD0788132.1 hypothetical protein [Vibrio sp. Y2-5]